MEEKNKRRETLEHLFEEMVELVCYVKNCMASLQIQLESSCEVSVTLFLSSFEMMFRMKAFKEFF